jgi:hypothetical protein
VCPTKADPNCTRITIGGNTINYTGDCGTKTGSIKTFKLVINSVLSTPNAKLLTANLANFYLGTPLDCQEYAQIKLNVIPQEFIDEYNLMHFVHNSWIYFEITKGMSSTLPNLPMFYSPKACLPIGIINAPLHGSLAPQLATGHVCPHC